MKPVLEHAVQNGTAEELAELVRRATVRYLQLTGDHDALEALFRDVLQDLMDDEHRGHEWRVLSAAENALSGLWETVDWPR